MRALGAAIVAVALLAAPVHADPSADHAAALVHLRRGVAAFRAGELRRAHEELALAHRLAPDKPNPYRWLALTEIQLGDCPSALTNIEGFLSRVPPDEPRVPELVRLRELCRQTAVLEVRLTPVGASLRIDGARVGVTPYRSLSMRAGTHQLAADKRGYTAQTRAIEVTAGKRMTVQLELRPAARPITRRWWFWTAVAGAVVAAASVAIVVTRSDGETILPPICCDGGGCAAALW